MGPDRRSNSPTMEDVAAVAGVSRALVSLVMRDSPKVSVHSRALVTAAAATLGYRPNLVARNLASRRTMTVGVVLDDLHNPWFAEVTDGLHEVLASDGYDMLLASGQRSRAVETRALETFLASRVDGIIVMGSRVSLNRLAAVSHEVPVVSIGRTTQIETIGAVNTDDARGAELAVEFLFDLGHRRIAHVDGGHGAGASLRRAGYLRAMRRLGLGDNILVEEGDFTEETGAAAGERLMNNPCAPTAVFAANDLSALGVIDVLARRGQGAPKHLSVVGFDNTSLASLNHIGLSTIDQPRRHMGALAGRMLVQVLAGTGALQHVVVPPNLIVRKTTGPHDAM